MSTTYKGFPLPEVMPDDLLFHIICDEGVFNGYSERAVLEKWKHKVDVILRQRALEDGYQELETLEGIFVCPDCGALIYDSWTHQNWHKNFTKLTHF